MAKHLTCPKGHIYDGDQYSICPYCPENKDLVKTIVNQPKQPATPANLTKTIIRTPQQEQVPQQNESSSLKRTMVGQQEKTIQSGTEQKKLSHPRRLIGWLVSFTLHPNGKDFRLFEGKNIIGSAKNCDICISGDDQISAEHLTILFRMEQIKYKDMFSTNGTFVNGTFAEEGELRDGDVITIGKTQLRFRSV